MSKSLGTSSGGMQIYPGFPSAQAWLVCGLKTGRDTVQMEQRGEMWQNGFSSEKGLRNWCRAMRGPKGQGTAFTQDLDAWP